MRAGEKFGRKGADRHSRIAKKTGSRPRGRLLAVSVPLCRHNPFFSSNIPQPNPGGQATMRKLIVTTLALAFAAGTLFATGAAEAKDKTFISIGTTGRS